MADGVFMQPQSGFSTTIADILQARYQDAAAKAAAAQRAKEFETRTNMDVVNRLTLSGPGGAPVSPNDYLAAVYGNRPMAPGITATPTTFATGAARNQTQENIAGEKSADEMKKLGVSMRQHWGQMLQPGQTKPASYFAPPELLKQYNIDPTEKISSSQRPAGAGGKGGGKSPEQTRLEALKATATSLYKQLGVASKEDAQRMFSSLRSLSPEQQHIKQQLAQIDAETAKLGGIGKGAGAVAPYGDTVVRDGVTYIWSPETGKYHPQGQ